MLKIKKSNLEPTYHFVPEEASLSLEERTGSMTLTLGPEHPSLEPGEWLMDDTEPGKGIVWRVKTIQENDDTATRTVTLEHIVAVLKDKIIIDEYDPGYVSAKTAINKALSYQSDFKLGTIEYSVTKPFSFNGDSVYDAIETVCTAMDDPVWTYDLSVRPFILNIKKRSDTVKTELRAGRNLKTLRKSIDRTGMYTRLYPRGENDLELSEKYVELNTGTYGIISKMETDQSQTSEDMLRVWALDRLKRHCEPKVSITIDGLELADATGESLDKLRIGTICQVPLPEMGTAIREKITKLNWKKKITAPEEVTVTLANNVDDIASFVKNESSSATASATRSGRSSAKKAKEDHAWFVDTEDHVGMVAEAVAGEGASKDWSRVSSVMVDGEGIHQRVTYAEGEIVKHEARIDVTEKAITQEVTDRSNADEELSGKLVVQADRITAEVTRAKGEETELRGALEVQADCVSLVTGVGNGKQLKYYATRSSFPATGSNKYLYMAVDSGKYYTWNGSTYVTASLNASIKAGGIVSAINADGTSTTRILGTRVVVGSDLTASSLPDWCDTTSGLIAEKATIGQLDAVSARVGTLEADSITTSNLSARIAALDGVSAKSLSVTNNIVSTIGYVMAPNFYIGVASNAKLLNNAVQSIVLSGPVNNVYTLKSVNFDGNETQIGTFSRATTLTGAWSSGKFTVSASPQPTSYNTLIFQGTATLEGNAYTVPIKAYLDGNTHTEYDTGISVYVDATARYNAGYDAISSSDITVDWTALANNVTGTPSGTASIPNKTSGTARSRSISLNMGAGRYTPTSGAHSGESRYCVEVKKGADVVVGRRDIQDTLDSQYRNGFDAGEDSVDVSSISRSGYTVTATLSNGHTGHLYLTEYPLYCTNVSPTGTGYYNVSFSITTHDSYSEGTTYNFYK